MAANNGSTARIHYDTLGGPVDEVHPVVDRETWLKERRELLKSEKEHYRQRDDLAKRRRALPWVHVVKDYSFESPEGTQTLSNLFAGRSQLVIYHFMFGPDWEEGCGGCSFLGDHFDGARKHFEHHDVRLVCVSRAPLAVLENYKKRMGWSFPWVSAGDSAFNYDFDVAWTPEMIGEGRALYNFFPDSDPGDEGHGFSVFYKDAAGRIFHTYSTYARGGEELLGALMLMDMTPKGRNEASTMNWVRRNDQYGC